MQLYYSRCSAVCPHPDPGSRYLPNQPLLWPGWVAIWRVQWTSSTLLKLESVISTAKLVLDEQSLLQTCPWTWLSAFDQSSRSLVQACIRSYLPSINFVCYLLVTSDSCLPVFFSCFFFSYSLACSLLWGACVGGEGGLLRRLAGLFNISHLSSCISKLLWIIITEKLPNATDRTRHVTSKQHYWKLNKQQCAWAPETKCLGYTDSHRILSNIHRWREFHGFSQLSDSILL